MQVKRRHKHFFRSPLSMAGVTLVELMVVVAIAGVLMGIAIPAYQDMVQDNCIVSNTNLLVGSLQLARSEAVKTRNDAIVQPLAAGWRAGWTITRQVDGVVVRTVNLTCAATTVVSTAGNAITYTARGTIAGQGGTFTICDNRTGETGRQVTITAVGRPQSSDQQC